MQLNIPFRLTKSISPKHLSDYLRFYVSREYAMELARYVLNFQAGWHESCGFVVTYVGDIESLLYIRENEQSKLVCLNAQLKDLDTITPARSAVPVLLMLDAETPEEVQFVESCAVRGV